MSDTSFNQSTYLYYAIPISTKTTRGRRVRCRKRGENLCHKILKNELVQNLNPDHHPISKN